VTTVFADTFFFLAFLNARDRAHRKAVDYHSGFGGKLITTLWILTELADALAGVEERRTFVDFFDTIADDASVEIIPADSQLFSAGMDLYRTRLDKEWSLTDCISFVVMRDRAMTEALTGDKHFKQAGFIPLLA
jgi:predicted nucleic acid-binding protein